MNIHAMLTLPFKLIVHQVLLSYMDQGIKVIALEFLIVVDLPDAHFHSVLLEKQRDRVLRTLLGHLINCSMKVLLLKWGPPIFITTNAQSKY